MRPSTILSEAWRDIRSGALSSALRAVVFAVLVGGLAIADTMAIDDVHDGADRYRSAGGATHVLEAPGMVDGVRCESLTRASGVVAAGALREAGQIAFAVLPSMRVSVHEATPGLASLVIGGDLEASGVVISEAVADRISVAAGARAMLIDGTSTQVAGVFPHPADGRSSLLEFATIAPVPAIGTFDQCWIEIWPDGTADSSVLHYALAATVGADGSDTQAGIGQLNATLGRTYDTGQLLADRVTRHADAAAVVVGLGLGAMSVRLRKIAIASMRHSGVPARAAVLQLAVETLWWASIGAVLALTAAALVGGADPSFAMPLQALRIVAVGAAATVLGSMASAALVRERHLFAYFRNR